ncbi:hypothetical protein [Hazenella coriacea]|uniref:Competence protein ComGG n=1 Tax=Hazenella coriacea TaxID=1179467 RepID=A0A4R3L4V8_9BACL|nr:hypothetical protein [Hazenella coriacea]TCS94703.1 hypothetical protein EDD58_103119 [Hazenella coriacea]
MHLRDEEGMVLPIVSAVSIIIFILVSLLIAESIRSRQTENLYWEKLRVQYAAESGIALMQQRLSKSQDRSSEVEYQVDGLKVHVKVKARDSDQIHLQATAFGSLGVKQTVQVYLSPRTLAIQKWFR